MGPPPKNSNGRTISQDAFNELVKENIDDLGMEPDEALEDAIQTLTLQAVDLSGIVTCVPGESNVSDNPVMQCLTRLNQLNDSSSINRFTTEIVELLDKLSKLCSGEGNSGSSSNVAIANRNGGIQLVCSLCSKTTGCCESLLLSGLKTLALLINDVQSTETFRTSEGPKIVVDIISNQNKNLGILNSCFAVVSAAATGNEVVKESFMELKIDDLILQMLNKQISVQSVYDAIRVLLTPDDNRVLASQTFAFARRFAKLGIAEALVDSLHAGLTSQSLVSATIALKAVAVNDEICKSIADKGGIDVLLQCIDDSSQQGNKIVAKNCCSLLTKLAGSDSNKNCIVEKGGMNKLIHLAARFSDDPSVLQEVMLVISVLCLRSPDNAAHATEAGAGDFAIQAMQSFPAAQQLQKNACIMIRNLVVRNSENRQLTLLLNNGIEKIIRKVKQNNASCKEAATDALRDLGLDNYNS
ncbi:hypothetical protein ACFE04_022594 [Oxalis oulophora]